MNFRQFCINIFKVGCVGFGGGNALVPILEETFVKKDSMKENAENFDKSVLVANLTPGALPVELSAAVGRYNFGIKGMIAGSVLFAAPGIIGALILFTLLSTGGTSVASFINVVAVGVSAFIVALLFEYIRDVAAKAKKKEKRHLFLTIAVMLSICLVTCGSEAVRIFGLDYLPVFSVSTVHLLVCVFFIAFFIGERTDFPHIATAAFISLIFLLSHGKAGIFAYTPIIVSVDITMIILSLTGLAVSLKGKNLRLRFDICMMLRDVGIWLAFILVFSLPEILFLPETDSFFLRDILSTVISFGGGDAYLTIADGMFVDTDIIPHSVFYSRVITVTNILPGSILCKTLFGIGYYIGYEATGMTMVAAVTGLAGFACSIGASCAVFFAVYYMYSGISDLPAVVFISEWIRPIVCGLLIKVMLSLINQSMSLSVNFGCTGMTILIFMLLLAAWNTVIRHRTQMSRWLLVLFDMAIVYIFFLTI